MSDGRIQVTYYAANEEVKAFDSFDEVASVTRKCIMVQTTIGLKNTQLSDTLQHVIWFTYSEINAWIRMVVDKWMS